MIAAMEARLAQMDPHAGSGKLPATDPREVLRRTIGYLRNNQEHMNYPTYRQQGLPVTSSLVESLIKEINYRVKGRWYVVDKVIDKGTLVSGVGSNQTRVDIRHVEPKKATTLEKEEK